MQFYTDFSPFSSFLTDMINHYLFGVSVSTQGPDMVLLPRSHSALYVGLTPFNPKEVVLCCTISTPATSQDWKRVVNLIMDHCMYVGLLKDQSVLSRDATINRHNRFRRLNRLLEVGIDVLMVNIVKVTC